MTQDTTPSSADSVAAVQALREAINKFTDCHSVANHQAMYAALAATERAAIQPAGEDINGPLTDAQRVELRNLYRTLHHLGPDAMEDVVRRASVCGYVNGRLDFAAPAATNVTSEQGDTVTITAKAMDAINLALLAKHSAPSEQPTVAAGRITADHWKAQYDAVMLLVASMQDREQRRERLRIDARSPVSGQAGEARDAALDECADLIATMPCQMPTGWDSVYRSVFNQGADNLRMAGAAAIRALQAVQGKASDAEVVAWQGPSGAIRENKRDLTSIGFREQDLRPLVYGDAARAQQQQGETK